MSSDVLEPGAVSKAVPASPSLQPSESNRCSFAAITHCDRDPDLREATLRECFRCGRNGLHHHFCANDERTKHVAADPNGPGTSLCAVCSGLQSIQVGPGAESLCKNMRADNQHSPLPTDSVAHGPAERANPEVSSRSRVQNGGDKLDGDSGVTLETKQSDEIDDEATDNGEDIRSETCRDGQH
eukprot:976532-Pleurochrysis_carterae.AAC.1